MVYLIMRYKCTCSRHAFSIILLTVFSIKQITHSDHCLNSFLCLVDSLMFYFFILLSSCLQFCLCNTRNHCVISATIAKLNQQFSISFHRNHRVYMRILNKVVNKFTSQFQCRIQCYQLTMEILFTY